MSIKAAKESDTVRHCLDYLTLRQIVAWRNNNFGVQRTDKSGRKFWQFAGRHGVSDILGVLPGGKFLAVECKAAGGKLTVEQELFLGDVGRAGGLAFVVRNVQDLIDALTQEGY